jgi:hypothetical protein
LPIRAKPDAIIAALVVRAMSVVANLKAGCIQRANEHYAEFF